MAPSSSSRSFIDISRVIQTHYVCDVCEHLQDPALVGAGVPRRSGNFHVSGGIFKDEDVGLVPVFGSEVQTYRVNIDRGRQLERQLWFRLALVALVVLVAHVDMASCLLSSIVVGLRLLGRITVGQFELRTRRRARRGPLRYNVSALTYVHDLYNRSSPCGNGWHT